MEDEGDAAVGNCADSKESGGDSTCCVVLLKNLARIGRRNVGGSVAVETGASTIDLRRARENILRLQIKLSWVRRYTGRATV